MTWAGTRSAVFERMCSTPAATSASWRLRRSSGPPGVEEVARHEVEEVLPRALGAPVAEARELLLEVLVVPALDEGDDLVLVARAPAR